MNCLTPNRGATHRRYRGLVSTQWISGLIEGIRRFWHDVHHWRRKRAPDKAGAQRQITSAIGSVSSSRNMGRPLRSTTFVAGSMPRLW